LQRRRYWWLPYVVLEFDKNEILIDALAGDLASPVWNYRADLCVHAHFASVLCHLIVHDSDVSRTSNIAVSAYLRTAPAQGQDDMGNDLLLARVDLTPMLEGHVRCNPLFVLVLPDIVSCSMHLMSGTVPPQALVTSI